MTAPTLQCHVYTHIPGTHPSWSLAVISVSRRDADNYMKAVNPGSKHAYQALPGSKVNANCGATTEAASAVIRTHNQELGL